MNDLDLMFIGFICVGGLIGGVLGLFRSLKSFFGFILAALLTWWTAPYFVTFLSKSSLDDRISNWIAGQISVNQWYDQYQFWVDDPQVKAAFAEQGFSGMDDILELQTNIANMGAQILLLITSSIVLFFVFQILFHRLLKYAERYLHRFSLHGKVNRIGGLVIGSLTAACLATFILAIWIPLSLFTESVSNKSFVGTDNSFVAQKWIPAVGLDKYLSLDDATDWLAPIMAKASTSIEQDIDE